MLWKSLLKTAQNNFIVPPNFQTCKVMSSNKCVYNLTFKRAFRYWAIVTSKGDLVRRAEQYEVQKQFTQYPKVHCSFLKEISNSWLVVYNNSVFRLSDMPEVEEPPNSFTSMIARRYGGVLIFDNYDFRNMQPWNVHNALALINNEVLVDKAPSWMNVDQKLVYAILLEEEKARRIPEPEQKIKSMLNKENASKVVLRERKGGYSISFSYLGRTRNITVREDLMLTDAGMCLEGMDEHFSLDSFLSILKTQ